MADLTSGTIIRLFQSGGAAGISDRDLGQISAAALGVLLERGKLNEETLDGLFTMTKYLNLFEIRVSTVKIFMVLTYQIIPGILPSI